MMPRGTLSKDGGNKMANNITRRDLFKASGTTALGLGVASLISACGSGSGSDSAISG